MEGESADLSTDTPPPPNDTEQSADIPPPDKLMNIHPLTEQCALNRSVAIWNSPKFLAYFSNHARLRTFRTWPHGMNPSPDSLSGAGFYYTGKNTF